MQFFLHGIVHTYSRAYPVKRTGFFVKTAFVRLCRFNIRSMAVSSLFAAVAFTVFGLSLISCG